MMQIVEIQWAPKVDMYVILCICGQRFHHRSDEYRVVCPHCGRTDTVQSLKTKAGLI